MAELPVGGEARGLAGVFGTSLNPLSVYMGYASQRQRNKAALAAQQKAERDKAMNYLDQFNPTSKFNELNYRVADRVRNNVRDWYVGNLEAGNSGPRLVGELKNRQGQELAYIEETNAWKAKLDELEKDIKQDPIRYKMEDGTGAISAIRDIYKNPDGSMRSDDEIRQGIADSDALRFDPRLLNTEGVVKKFTSDLPEQSRVLLTKAYSAMGYSPDQIENIVKSGLTYEMEQGPDGQMRPALDDDLMPKVVVDEKLYRLAKADPYMNSLMNAASPEKGRQMQWLKENVRGTGDKVIQDRQVISGKKIDQENDPRNFAFGIGFGVPVANIEARRDWLEKATSGNRADLLKAVGNLTKDIRADYSPDKKKIVIKFPSGIEDPEIMNNPNLAGILISPGKAKGTAELDISTPQAKRAARQALSEIIDSQLRDTKQAIGTDNYVRYEEAYAKSKQKGASGIKWK